MQSSERLLAGRYARALFEAAAARKEEDRVRRELAEAARALREHEKAFLHPLLPAGEKKALLKKLVKGVSPVTQRFLELLVERKRWALLAAAAQGYERALDESRKTVRAQVRSARALPADEQERLRKRLEAFVGKTVQLELREDPELIGGVVVRMGDWVLDASLAHRLRRMRENFVA
jgi:F-type H+-transporting ATPase subunit delta